MSISMTMSMNIEEDTMVNQNKSIVTILNCNSDTNFTPNSPSLRRVLSENMSTMDWFPQAGSSNSIKKISSFENLFNDDEFGETKLNDEAEAERERLEIWSSIQKNKMEEQQKGGSFDTWSSLISLKSNDETSKSLPPYIHPLAKRTKSSLSRKSLEICTESLGSETGSDGLVFFYRSFESLEFETRSDGLFISNPPAETEDTKEQQHQEQGKVHEGDKKEDGDEAETKEEVLEVKEVVRYNYGGVSGTTKKSPPRSFPPPLPSLSRQDGPSLHMRPHRDNGRLVLEVVSLPSLNNFCVQRQDGRLVLTFANQNQEIVENEKENNGVDDLGEEFEVFEGENNNENEDDNEEEVEDEKGDDGESNEGYSISCEKNTIKSSVQWIGSNNSKVNKPIVVVNRNPKWSKEFKNEVDNNNFKEENVQVVKASQMVKSLPPKPRVARLIPSQPNATSGSFNLNSYEHYWRTTKHTSTKSGNYPLGNYQENNNNNNNHHNNNNKNKIVVSNERQQLLILKRKNGDYLVHNLKSCKDSRRSFLFWEPYCIATS